MKINRSHNFLWIALFLLILFIVVSSLTFLKSKGVIEKSFLASEGSAAENFAVLTAANIHLTDEQVETLKNYNYSDLINSEENKTLKAMMANDSFVNKVDYAYIMVHLKDHEIKYKVTEQNKNRYDAPVGTKLDIMWLLDVNLNENSNKINIETKDKELLRYSYFIEEDKKIFEQSPTYILNASEWGKHICGYAPIYTSTGNYIGVVGVELKTGDYDAYCSQAIATIGSLLFISLAMLSLLFLYLSFKYKKAQFDKIYIDSLTGVYNRSYYNNLFMKRMNKNSSKKYFALMIIDIDWFKKVNDTFGHDVGDEVLKEFGLILLKTMGKEHVARFGGEEFVAGLWVSDENDIRVIAECFFDTVKKHKFSSKEIDITISLGCSYFETTKLDGWIMSGMLRAADCKLYEAKETGRKQYLIELYDKNKQYTKKNMNAAKEKQKSELK